MERGYLSFRERTALADGVCLVGCARAYVCIGCVWSGCACAAMAHLSQEMSMATVGCSCHGHVPACGVLGRAARALLRDHNAVVRVNSVCVRGGPSVLCVVVVDTTIDDTTVSVRV